METLDASSGPSNYHEDILPEFDSTPIGIREQEEIELFDVPQVQPPGKSAIIHIIIINRC